MSSHSVITYGFACEVFMFEWRAVLGDRARSTVKAGPLGNHQKSDSIETRYTTT